MAQKVPKNPRNNSDWLNEWVNNSSEKFTPEEQKRIDKMKISEETRKKELELARILEKQEKSQNKGEIADFLPEFRSSPENIESSEKQSLEEIFGKIETDHVSYPLFRRIFPNFIRVCEESRIGKSFSHDVLGLAIGIGESLLSTAKLGKDVMIDVVKFALHPIRSYQETQDFI